MFNKYKNLKKKNVLYFFKLGFDPGSG